MTGSKLNIELNGVSAGTQYDQIITAGLNLDDDSNGGASLEISLGYEPAINDSFTIIQITDVFPSLNHFNGLPGGAEFVVDGTLFSITYVGGDGNDVVLTALSSNVRYVNANAAPNGDGLSWGTAFDNLQDALATGVDGMEIWVAQGVYYPDIGIGQVDNDVFSTFNIPNGVKVYGGFDGTETDISQQDPDTYVTVLSGDIDNNDTVNNDGITI